MAPPGPQVEPVDEAHSPAFYYSSAACRPGSPTPSTSSSIAPSEPPSIFDDDACSVTSDEGFDPQPFLPPLADDFSVWSLLAFILVYFIFLVVPVMVLVVLIIDMATLDRLGYLPEDDSFPPTL